MKKIRAACLNIKCAKNQKHVKSCTAYGKKYLTKNMLFRGKDGKRE